jgi:integrase
MGIKEITKESLGKTKAGWTWCKKRQLFSTWQIDTIFNSERHVRRGFPTEQKAKDYLEQLEMQEKLQSIGVLEIVKYPTIKDLFEKRLKDIENKSEKVRARRVFRTFESLLKPATTIDQITKSDYKNYADFRLSQNVEKSSINREINPISKAFSSVPEYYPIKKWIKPQVFKFSVSSEGRNRIIDATEYQKILEYLLGPQKQDEQFHHFKARYRSGLIFQFALMTGLRHGEICGMEKDKLNIQKREINVYRFKTKRWKIYAPLTDTMLYLLSEGAKLYPNTAYFFSSKGILQMGIYDQIKAACNFHKIPYGKFTKNGIIIHDARRTFITILHANLIDNKTTVEFTDNPTALGNYQHSTIEAKRRAMAIIENQLGTGEKSTILQEIFDAVKNNEMEFETFEKSINDFFTVF